MKTAFNLLDHPWIPVIMKDNTSQEVSLLDAIIHSDDYRAIDCEYASQNFAITRLIIAYLYSSIDFDTEHWRQYWMSGFPEDAILSYAAKWHHRFNLIDEHEPFMQAPDLAIKDDRILPLTKMVPDVSEGKVFYTKTEDSFNTMDFSTAAKFLVQGMWYDPCGGHTACIGDTREGTTTASKGRVYPSKALLASMTGIMLTGINLKETLLLCAPASDSEYIMEKYPERIVGGDGDRPLWEKDVLHVGGADNNNRLCPSGVVNCLTFPTRRIKLFADDERITGCIVTAGDAIDLSDARPFEQMCAWKKQEDKDNKDIKMFKPIQRSQQRALWRGMSSLLSSSNTIDDDYSRPLELDWFYELIDKDIIPVSYRLMIDAITVRYDAPMFSKITDILEDKIPLPGKILSDYNISDEAILGVNKADIACSGYIHFVDTVSFASGNTDGMGSDERNSFYAGFYSRMQGLYYDWLLTIVDDESHMEQWIEILKNETINLAKEYAELAPPTAIIGIVNDKGHIQSINAAYAKLYKELKKL